MRADGSARPAGLQQKTPSPSSPFQPSVSQQFDRPITRRSCKCIDEQVASPNLFCAVRVDGEFSHVETRTVPRQERPYRPMLEAIEEQPTFSFHQRRGTLVGFRSPDYMQGIGVAGYHEHFVTDDRSGGGHVLDYQLDHGRLQFGVITVSIFSCRMMRISCAPTSVQRIWIAHSFRRGLTPAIVFLGGGTMAQEKQAAGNAAPTWW